MLKKHLLLRFGDKELSDISQAALLLGALPMLPRTMVGLAILSGLRRGELFTLRWKDIESRHDCSQCERQCTTASSRHRRPKRAHDRLRSRIRR
jgi:integrase